MLAEPPTCAPDGALIELPPAVDGQALNEPATGVIPLSWAESQDERRNSRFEALSHIPEADSTGPGGEYWTVFPVLEENRVFWRAALGEQDQRGVERYDTADAAKAAALQVEIELGGAAHAPRAPRENPDASVPLVTDEHGFAPTRTIRSEWSRREGALYLYRVWAKPDAPEQTITKRLEGDEYEAAVLPFIRQRMVQELVGHLTKPGGFIIPLTWQTPALGYVRMEVAVHFAEVRGLYWAREAKGLSVPPREELSVLEAPSHAMICSIIAETLARRKEEFDKQLAGTTEDEMRRQIAKNARALGIASPIPEQEQETGFVLPATLEDMQRAGVDLRGASLKG